MFDRILVPLDGSALAAVALDAAGKLADRWDAEIEVLTLFRWGDESSKLDETVMSQAGRIEHDSVVDIRPVSASVAEDIAAEVDKVENTLVVMSTMARGRSAGIVSNIAEDVMQRVRQPMLLLGPNNEITRDWPAGPLCVCTDGSDFAESIVPLSAAWAVNLDLDPVVLSVTDPSEVPAGMLPAAETKTAAHLARRMKQTTGAGVNYASLRGRDAAKAIVDHAKNNDASIIALATHGRSGVDRVRYGSVAMGVIRYATCPVLVNRPPVDPEQTGEP